MAPAAPCCCPTAILQLHIVLFLLLWVVFAGFVFILLNPLIKRVVKEVGAATWPRCCKSNYYR